MDFNITRATSGEVVDSVNDLLIQILINLPVKSLMRFKLVSKHWKSLITSRQFALVRHPGPNPAVGLVCPGRRSPKYEYLHLDLTKKTKLPFRELCFPWEDVSCWVHQSCNGLLLCCSSGGINVWGSRSPIRSIYVYNPTTNCFAKLPRPGIVKEVPRIVVGVNLAFDLTKFPNYKVVCVRGSEFAPDLYQIEIYSAETGVWTLSGEPFSSSASFNYGVYWNGSIHWISYERKELLYFHVDEERFGKMALPGEGRRRIAYFGESCDHLHIIETQNTEKSFHVYEMKRDYSEWFVKYYVDLTGVAAAFPDTVFYLFYVYSLVRFEQRPFLVLEFGRKTVRFNLDCNTFEEISKLGDIVVKSSFPHAFEYIESLASVGGH